MKLEVLREAEEEAARESEFYEDRERGLGQAFLDELQLVFERITSAPLHHVQLRKRPNLRMALIERFPFKVIFELEADTVRVVAVCHQKRHARFWRGRS